MNSSIMISRKEFLSTVGKTVIGGSLISGFGFPWIRGSAQKKKLGVALVGLGSYAGGQLAPGLQRTTHCELRGVVTGTPAKIPRWQKQYSIPDRNVYNYENMHKVANNDDIDVLYIVTPPALHAPYAVKAAQAGKHVWCEKPMAMNAAECESIIAACEKNGVTLTIGYRMQHEPNTRTIMKFGEQKPYVDFNVIVSGAGYRGAHSQSSWRTKADLGGGALYDMGVYPINGIRYASGMEPVAVRGRQWSERKEMYAEVDEFTEFEMRFSNGLIAKGETAFGKSTNYLRVDCEDGWYKLQPMQSYSGVRGETSDGRQLRADPNDQQARQMDNDAKAILENNPVYVPGEEGLRDIRIVNAIQESSEKGREWVSLV
jgi:glucose-fructose oxidoreductase